MAIWDDVLTERDKAVFREAGYGQNGGFGKRPALLVIDIMYEFCGEFPEPILESIKKWRNSCGEEAWLAIEQVQRLLKATRMKHIPVIYTTMQDTRTDGFDLGRWADKNSRYADKGEIETSNAVMGNEIVAAIAPQPQDIVIKKAKPSAFFGTLLAAYLADLQVDTLICCGTTTSGCVRASVIDGFSYNYHMAIVEECTFDRAQVSHKVNLCDMHQKYADVVKLADTLQYLGGLPGDLFARQMPSLHIPRAATERR